MDLKLLIKRGALLAAANWPAVVIQFIAETMFQVLLAVPIVGAAVLIALLIGADLSDLMQGSLRDMFTTIASVLVGEPIALVAFVIAIAIVVVGGSVLMFLVKGGTIDVLLAGHEAAGAIEREPITLGAVRPAAAFTLRRFMDGCARLFRPYVALGLALTAVYAVSGAAYFAVIVYAYRAAAGVVLVAGWTIAAAIAAGALISWITIVNLLYLLLQIAIAVDGGGIADACRGVARFVRAELRELSAVFLVILALVVAATLASALAWSGVALVGFVPLVGLAVVPLQIAAFVVRGLAFEYIGLAAAGAYVTLYTRTPRTLPRTAVSRVDRPAPAITD